MGKDISYLAILSIHRRHHIVSKDLKGDYTTLSKLQTLNTEDALSKEVTLSFTTCLYASHPKYLW